ncbi:MAG: SAF domain-containing protein [Opitutales bacterium]
MLIIDNALRERERRKTPLRVGMVGAGEMAKGMINQISRHTPGMTVAATYSRTAEKALLAYEVAGITDFVVTDDAAVADKVIMAGKSVITSDINLLIDLKLLDVLVESTGSIEFGADTMIKAFNAGRSVLSFNAELDSIFGPILKHKAHKAGVRYSLGDGDQPGVTMNLHRYVTGLGFEPLLCGNIKGLQDHYRTPDTQRSFAEKWGMNPEMATNFADGTKISFEQACIANATGMKVAKRGMLGYSSADHVDNLTRLYDVDELRSLGGIVDYVVGAKPGPGVFIYATISDPLAAKYLKYGKLGNGPLYSFYVPYHLLFFDIASSICRLVDFNDPTIVAREGPVVDVVAAAKTDLQPGERLDGIGGFKTYGVCENHPVARSERLLPMALTEGCRVTRGVRKDEVLSWDHVEIASERFVDRLLEEQNILFNGQRELRPQKPRLPTSALSLSEESTEKSYSLP